MRDENPTSELGIGVCTLGTAFAWCEWNGLPKPILETGNRDDGEEFEGPARQLVEAPAQMESNDEVAHCRTGRTPFTLSVEWAL